MSPWRGEWSRAASRACAGIGASLLLLAASGPGEAHAIVVASTPAADAVVTGPDVAIELRFNSRIDHERSRLTLYLADGPARPLAQAPDSAPDVVDARAAGLVPGSYRLRWQVLAVDGHITRGDILFRVVAP